MNILLFGMSSYPGGIENYLVNYFCNDSFPSDKIHIDFVTYEPTIAYEDKLLAKGYQVCHVPHLKKNPIEYFRAIKSLMTENRYDAVYVNMLTAANALPVYAAAHFKIKKIILHAHASSTVDGFVRRLLHKINRGYCNRMATTKLACSEKAGKWLFRTNDFSVIPNAIDCDRFSPSEENRREIRDEYEISQDTLLIGHIGRFATEKNHVFMIDILKAVIAKGVDAKVMFVGDGYTIQDVRQKVENEELTDRICFVGTTSHTEKYYPAFDVFLFPSTFEGFGMAALEAQSCGVPCVCSDTLSESLNVSGINKICSLQNKVEEWANAILSFSNIDRFAMNRAVCDSVYNIHHQIENLCKTIYQENNVYYYHRGKNE